MINKDRGTTNQDKVPRKKSAELAHITPFDTAEELWFWFITAQQARNDGARFVAGQGTVVRPCEPSDILKILDRLYRTRRLHRDHLLVLRHYGRRQLPPSKYRAKEVRSAHLWEQAMERLEPILERKGIIIPVMQAKAAQAHPNWVDHMYLYEEG